MLRPHRALVAVLALYAGAAVFVVPTMTPAPVSDDWVYARSVELLVRDGELRVLDLSVVTLLFQVVWGSLFSLVFGLGFGAMRLSTVVLTATSGVALYGLCRELGVDRVRSGLGVAVYLFNPLAYVLGFSFMTDPQFAALLVISTYFYARGLRLGDPNTAATLAGAAVAGCAFLVRQQGALIPLAVVIYLLLARRLRPDRAGMVLFLRVVAIPAVATVLYYAWLFFIHGVPVQQESFTTAIRTAGWDGTVQLLAYLTFIEVVYLGFFTLPIVLGALVGMRRLLQLPGWGRWACFGAWLTLLSTGLVVFARGPQLRMPYVSQFVGTHGLGPADLWGGRPSLVSNPQAFALAFTVVAALSSGIFGLALARKVWAPVSPDRAAAGLALAVGLWQVIGVLPPSYHFRNWIISVDRYLLPLLPFAVVLLLWALRGVRLALPVAWAGVLVIGAFSVTATRDFLVFQDATWDLATYANRQVNIPLTRLDGGSSWDGYHLWEYSDENGIPQQSWGGPWWTNLFATATDSSFVISGSPYHYPCPVAGCGPYEVIASAEYSSWLNREPTYLYLLQRMYTPQALVPPPPYLPLLLPPDLPPPPLTAPPRP